MGDLSEHFNRSEFFCKCRNCDPKDVSGELVDVLELVRSKFKKPVTVTSGYRCIPYNKLVGGAKNSKHLLGIAADIVVKDIPAIEVQHFLQNAYPDKYGIGSYSNFTHVDVRDKCARW